MGRASANPTQVVYKINDLVYRSEFLIDSREWKLWLERVSSYLASGLIVQRSLSDDHFVSKSLVFRVLNLESHMDPLQSMFRSACLER